jgi:hypothetical protein
MKKPYIRAALRALFRAGGEHRARGVARTWRRKHGG